MLWETPNSRKTTDQDSTEAFAEPLSALRLEFAARISCFHRHALSWPAQFSSVERVLKSRHAVRRSAPPVFVQEGLLGAPDDLDPPITGTGGARGQGAAGQLAGTHVALQVHQRSGRSLTTLIVVFPLV